MACGAEVHRHVQLGRLSTRGSEADRDRAQHPDTFVMHLVDVVRETVKASARFVPISALNQSRA